MRNVTLNNLKTGMVLGRDVVSRQGRLILCAEFVLDQQSINRLRFYCIHSVDIIENDDYELTEPQEAVSSGSLMAEIVYSDDSITSRKSDSGKAIHIGEISYDEMKERLKNSPIVSFHKTDSQTDNFRSRRGYHKQLANYFIALKLTKDLFSKVSTSKSISESDIVKITNLAFNENNPSFSLFEWLNIIRDLNDPIYAQSLNCALLCKALGQWLGYSESDCNILAGCGLLHDIGKLKIAPDILNKPGQLTDDEFSIIKAHPLSGFEMIKTLEMDPRVKKAALQHHERIDGSGYPFRRTQKEIHPFSQITAICDVYMAMTTNRSHRRPLSPFDVIKSFEHSMHQYTSNILYTFLENIATAYQQSIVILNDGREGTIVMHNRNSFSSPVIQLTDGSFIDLAQATDLHIEHIK